MLPERPGQATTGKMLENGTSAVTISPNFDLMSFTRQVEKFFLRHLRICHKK